jgi:hypothetical protein
MRQIELDFLIISLIVALIVGVLILTFPRLLNYLYQFDLTAPCMTAALDKLRKGSLIYDSIRWNWY